MFQISILKNFVKSYTTPPTAHIDKIHRLVSQPHIAEDANGAEYITLLSHLLNWSNISREVKNTTDMKKADGVVYDKQDNPIAIIELKSSDKNISNTDTIAQAFRYKNEKPTCKVVIISNFKQLDIYSDSSDKCFRLDMAQKSSYKTLYALLCQSSMDTGHISRLKAISKSQEQITKEVYRLYSSFRLQLINNLIANNPNQTKEQLLAHSVKLLDRYMFVLFAEDRGLIPANSIDKIIAQYETAKDGWDEARPLYYYYKKYFEFIDIGNPSLDIPRYNGNLFKPDIELDSLTIDDHIIKDDLSHLSAYDFSDDVDVEVLGHIFEQSLNDLEKIKESLITTHTVVDTRKKDGVYYTPKFITRYIIEHTIGTLCYEQKLSLDLLQPMSDTATKKQKQTKLANLKLYKTYIENLKIVDPACGSGAFLNMAYRYLLDEHQYIQTQQTKAGAGLLDMHHIDKSIIENNLYGVDINTASVGIAKLSLWLQTAKRDRPLSDLRHNIICANSLTANWSELFADIINNGGFDVVIGNPPYVRHESIKDQKPQLKQIYKLFVGTADLYVYFYELAQNILKTGGINGFICSNKFFRAKYGQNLREMILEHTTIKSIVDYNSVKVFEDATVDSAITILQKGYTTNNNFQISLNDTESFFDMAQSDLSKESFSFVSPKELAIKKKIQIVGTPLKEWDINIYRGILTGFNEAFIIDGDKKDELIKLDSKNREIIKPLLRGRDIKKYDISFADLWIIGTFPTLNLNIDDYPIIKEYLESFGKRLEQTGEIGSRKKTNNKWFETQDTTSYYKNFEKPKIVYPETVQEAYFSYDTNSLYIDKTAFMMTGKNLKFIFSIVSSKLLTYFYKKYCGGVILGEKGYQYNKHALEKLPIPNIPTEEQEPYIKLVDGILTAKETIAKYRRHIDSLNAVEKIEILQSIAQLEGTVAKNIEDIDTMVYGLYGLSADEKQIVEGTK